MLTTAPSRALEVWAEAQTLRIALIASPTAVVPPAGLRGVDQVRRLAEGLAERNHQVTLIGAGLSGLVSAGYAVIDTDPTDGQHTSPEILARRHAEQVGKVLEQLGDVDVVSDHTRTGWQPADGEGLHARTVQTSSWPMVELWQPVPKVPDHLGWVAVSEHQQRNAPDIAWVDVIHPGIPIGRHPLKSSHAGPCAYVGPLLKDHGAGLAIEAAHRARRPIVLAGTQASAKATAYTEVELRPQLAAGDELLETVSPQERWELLGNASCLIAPLHAEAAHSLEVVEAMAYGTPVVTLVGTVGAELVSHGVSGLVARDAVLLPEAIGKAERLDPLRVRAHAASRFDLVGMVSAYEWLFLRLAAAAESR